jgi:hypothetical protein
MKARGLLCVVALFVAGTAAACGSEKPHQTLTYGNSTTVPGVGSGGQVPKNRLIVPGVSIGGIRFGEPRRNVTKALGRGKRATRWVVSYLGGRLQVDYSFHDGYTGRARPS